MIEHIFQPTLWIGATLIVYLLALRIYQRSGSVGVLHPILFSTTVLGALLFWLDLPVERYQYDTRILSWLLLPATIALAIPLFNQLPLIRQQGIKLIVPIIAGGVVAPTIAVGIFWAFGLDQTLVASVATKSITTPLAIDTTETIGGYPSLAAVIVILTGIIGASLSQYVFKLANIKDARAKGIALGTAAHAIGVAHAATIGPKSTGFATLALCINGVITSVSLSLLYLLWL